MLGSLPHARKERAGVAFLCRKHMELLFRTLSLHSRTKVFSRLLFQPSGMALPQHSLLYAEPVVVISTFVGYCLILTDFLMV